MSEQSIKLKRATPDQAKAAWEAHPAPSVRTVCEALREIGLSCAVATLQRWHKAGWVLKTNGRRKDHAKAAAKAQEAVAKGVDRQDDKTLTRLEMFAAEEATMKDRAEALGEIEQDSELARQAMRTSLIAQIILSEQIIRRAAFLMEVAPDRAAKLIEALKGPAASTTIVIPPEQSKQQGDNGDGAKVVDGRVIEQSPTAMAISSFKLRRKEGVAA